MALAEAVVLALEERLDEAHEGFGRAQAGFKRYRLPLEEADVLHEWGRALARAGDRSAALERLDEALDILRGHGAGTGWLERVSTDRRALD